jgi:hypothetical protein
MRQGPSNGRWATLSHSNRRVRALAAAIMTSRRSDDKAKEPNMSPPNMSAKEPNMSVRIDIDFFQLMFLMLFFVGPCVLKLVFFCVHL